MGEVSDSLVIQHNFFFFDRPSRCVLPNLYNVLYTTITQQYISTVI